MTKSITTTEHILQDPCAFSPHDHPSIAARIASTFQSRQERRTWTTYGSIVTDTTQRRAFEDQSYPLTGRCLNLHEPRACCKRCAHGERYHGQTTVRRRCAAADARQAFLGWCSVVEISISPKAKALCSTTSCEGT